MTADELKAWITRRFPRYGTKGRLTILQPLADELGISLSTLHKNIYGFGAIGRQTIIIIRLIDRIEQLEGRWRRKPKEPPKPKPSDREAEILAAYKETGTLRGAGEKLGVKHQRVHAVVQKFAPEKKGT